MNDANKSKAGWKQRLVRELIDYWVTFLYLAVFFGTYTWYRRLVLAEYRITYLHYGVALIEALVLAKVILVGRALQIGRELEDKPLILSALYKSFVFSLFVGLFGVLEHTLGGLLHGKGVVGGWDELVHLGKDELLARCLVTFCAFIPFFAIQELGRVLGDTKIQGLLFRRRTVVETGPSSA